MTEMECIPRDGGGTPPASESSSQPPCCKPFLCSEPFNGFSPVSMGWSPNTPHSCRGSYVLAKIVIVLMHIVIFITSRPCMCHSSAFECQLQWRVLQEVFPDTLYFWLGVSILHASRPLTPLTIVYFHCLFISLSVPLSCGDLCVPHMECMSRYSVC